MLSTSASSQTSRLVPCITLTPVEHNITSLLKEYCTHYNATNAIKEPLEPRITGGWVRDKLLGQTSHDLDIAVNVMSGQEFAEGLLEYLKTHPREGGDQVVGGSGIHTIEKNPEKSKHLETATTKLFGLDIDFVNLRNEEYTEESRIPQIKFGTPEEDAMRRDATLNALFYNIQREQVEDFTRLGLKDLEQGILRTPLEPRKTFLDDPLRVLRLIRFASRFGFDLDSNTFQAMKGQEVKKALIDKISRERVGVEMGKTLESDAVKGLRLLSETGLMSVVFGFGNLDKDIRQFNDIAFIDEHNNQVDNDIWNAIEKITSFNFGNKLTPVVSEVLSNPYEKRLLWISVVLRPWAGLKVVFNKKQKQMWASEAIVREGLKFSKNDADMVTKISSTSGDFQAVVNKLPEFKRSEIGFVLRNYDAEYKLALVFNLFDEVIKNENDKMDGILSKYEQMWDLIHAERLEDVYKLKPLVDGKKVCKVLDRKPGPWMAPLTNQILVWQLDNPDKSEEECLQFIKGVLEK